MIIMNKTLHKHLSDNWTVRIGKDGNKVEKPSEVCLMSLSESMKNQEQWDTYNNATEVIKLPTRDEFWDKLMEHVVRGLLNFQQVVELNNLFILYINTDLQLGQFITCKDGKPLEEPEQFENWDSSIYPTYKKQKGKCENWSARCYEYQAAQEAVIFYGWEVLPIDNKRIVMCTDGLNTLTFFSNQNVLIDNMNQPAKMQVKTISDIIPFGVYLKPNL